MDAGKTKDAVALTEAQRARLRSLVGAGAAPARMPTRARVLLKANRGEGRAVSFSAEAEQAERLPAGAGQALPRRLDLVVAVGV